MTPREHNHIEKIKDYITKKNVTGEFCSFRTDAYEEDRLENMGCEFIEISGGIKIVIDIDNEIIGALYKKNKYHIYVEKKEKC